MKKCILTMMDQGQDYTKAVLSLNNKGIEVEWKKEIKNSQNPSIVSEACRDANIIINGIEIWNEEVIQACNDLELIIRYGVGYSNIDVDAATKHGVAVAFLPGVNAKAVAEYAVMLMLSSVHKLGFANNILHQGGFAEATGLTTQFEGKTIGILGCGRIGKEVCRMLSGFQVRILATDVCHDVEFAEKYHVNYVSREELFANSDIISVHVPAIAETRHIINEESIKLMKDGVVLVNTSRGSTVDSIALAEAVRNRKVYAAGLDVFEGEGSEIPQAPFISYEEIILTPHLASSTYEIYSVMMDKCLDIIDGFYHHEDISHWLLNPEVLS